jgi:hypothetical protein
MALSLKISRGLSKSLGAVSSCALQAAMVLGLGAVPAGAPTAALEGGKLTLSHTSPTSKPVNTRACSPTIRTQDGYSVVIPRPARVASSPSLPNRNVGWEEAVCVPPGPLAFALEVYGSLLGLLGLGKAAARRGGQHLRALQEARALTQGALPPFLQQAQEMIQELGQMLAQLPEERITQLVETLRAPDLRSRTLPEQVAKLLEIAGPEGSHVAVRGLEGFRQLAQLAPSACDSAMGPLRLLFEDAQFVSAPPADQVRQLSEVLIPAVHQLEAQGRLRIGQLEGLLQALSAEKREALAALWEDPTFQSDTPEQQVAQLADTLFGATGTKFIQLLGDDESTFVGRVVAASRSRLLPMPPTVRNAILERQGAQDPNDLARDIFHVGGERYQFDFTRRPRVASVGEVHRAIRLSDGRGVVFKIRKPTVTSEALERDGAFLESCLKLWVPGEQHTQLQGYLHRIRQDLLVQLDYAKEEEHANEFNHAYADAPFSGVIPLYVSPAGDVLAMEEVDGMPLAQLATLPHAERLEAELAYLQAMVAQICRGIFHADALPDNVFWSRVRRSLTFLDMGSASRLGPLAKLQLIEQMLVLMTRDAKATASFMIRSAERLTSDLPSGPLEKTLADQLVPVLSRNDLSPKKMADEVRRVSERNGVWPSTDRALLYRAIFIMDQTLKSPEVRAQVRRETLRQLFGELAEVVRGVPREAGAAVRNVSIAVGRKPLEFGKSALELMKPEQLEWLADALDEVLRKATFRSSGLKPAAARRA